MKRERKQTFEILIRHLLIGFLVTIFIFWLMNEIPNSDYLLARQGKNKYLVAFGFIFFSWTIAFLSTAISEGILGTIRNRRFEILDALVGYGIYQLWLYWFLGIIHGLTGGLFLAMDFKKLKNE